MNSLLSVLSVAGILGGLHFYGVTGLLVGALLPRLLLATWMFPRLALRALRVEAEARGAIWREGAKVALALLVGGSVAFGAQHLAFSAWWPGLAGIAGYGTALFLISGALQREVRSLARASAAP